MNNFGCRFLEEGINFDAHSVTDCCILHHDNQGSPLLISDYNGESIDWDMIFEIKANRINSHKNQTIDECKDCFLLTEYNFKNEKRISEFQFSCCQICNAKCIYCYHERYNGKVNYDLLPVIKDLIQKGLYKSGGEASFQGGEPTLMKNFEELTELFLQNGTFIRVNTNVIKYSDKIYEFLKQDKGMIVTSLDCGCRKTYKKIKQVNCFDKCVENIKMYSSANRENVIVKYVIIPGINDNIREIDKFFDVINSIGIINVALDMESLYARKYDYKHVSPHIYLLVDYFNHLAKIQNVKVSVFSYMNYVLNNRNIKPSKFIKNKLIYSIIVSLMNERHKKFDYSINEK